MRRTEFLEKAFKLVVGKGLAAMEENRLVATLERMAEMRQRPPGAHSSDEIFRTLCSGCDQCMIACPINVIMVEDQESRLPVIYPESDPCIHCDGTPCIASCPTGALAVENGTDLRVIG